MEFHKGSTGFDVLLVCLVLSCAIEVGSPINHVGAWQRRDTGQGSFSGLDLTPNDRLLKIEKYGPTHATIYI